MNNLFYTTKVNESTLVLEEQEAVHCALVLRKKVGDIIYVIDGNGNRYKCGIDKLSKRDVECTILSTESQPKSEHITIAIAPTKNRDRLEWMLEKLVEIGVERIILMNTSNTERTRTNLERLEKKVVSAVKQSLRFYIPEVVEMEYKKVLEIESQSRYIAHCYDDLEKGYLNRAPFDSAQDDGSSLRNVQEVSHIERSRNVDLRLLVLIGPEGDFTTQEVEQAFEAGFKGLDLGEFRLRTETAAIVAVARFQ